MSLEPERIFELMQKTVMQNAEIISQNILIESKLDMLLSETKELKRINDDQLKELKKEKNS